MRTPNRETFLATLREQATADVVPVWEVWFCMPELAVALREEAGVAEATGLGARVRNFLPAAERLGWSCIAVGGGGPPLPRGRETASDGTDHYVQGALTDYAQLEAFEMPDLDPILDEVRAGVEIAHAAGLAAAAYLPWCFHSICTAMGLEAFSYNLVDRPEFVHRCFDYIENHNRKMIEQVVLPSGADLVLFDGDCAYKNGLMVGPETFRDLVVARTAETVNALHAADIPYVLHSDGKCDQLLPVLIELGFSGFHGVEAAANDLAAIKARFGRDITLIGNMDIVFLTHATPDEARAATRRMLATGAPGGRYVAACNTSPMDYIPDANYLAMYDTIAAWNAGER